MWSKLPECLQSDDIKKYYMGISEIFDMLEREQVKDVYTSVLSKLKGKALDRFGECYGIKRKENSDVVYRSLILIETAKNKFVPTIDNYAKLINDVTGYSVTISEGWSLVPSEKALLKVFVTVAEGFDYDFFKELDNLYSCGAKLIVEYVSKIDGVNFLNAQILINHDTIKIGGE
ncbi:MAG: hypothetical protein ACRC0G_10485 [Fusobacteriaceae bacterium]